MSIEDVPNKRAIGVSSEKLRIYTKKETSALNEPLISIKIKKKLRVPRIKKETLSLQDQRRIMESSERIL